MSKITDILELTWQELDRLDKTKTVLFVTFAPIEEHGLHLGLGVDIYEGTYWQNNTVQELSKIFPDYNFLLLPFFPIAHGLIAKFPGNLAFKQNTLRQVAVELLENIIGWGINKIVIIASHGAPSHLIAIEEACVKINRKYGLKAFSPMGSFFSYPVLREKLDFRYPDKLTKYFQEYQNDIHAGWIETSMMFNIKPYVVKEGYGQLPDIAVDYREMRFPDKVAKKVAGYGHIGYPKLADSNLGVLLNETIIQFLTKTVGLFLRGEDISPYQHHFLYKIPFLRAGFRRKLGYFIGIIIALIILLFLTRILTPY